MGEPEQRRGRSRDGAGSPGSRTLGSRPGRVDAPGELERHAADEDRGRDERRASRGLAASRGARPDRAEDRRQARRGGAVTGRDRSARGRSRRRRTWPTWITSPKPSGATPSTGAPLTNVPFVLPRSSTYQARPRKVSIACSAETNWSSTTIALLTSRPRRRDRVEGEHGAPSGSPPGEATTTQAAELGAGLAGGRAEVADEARATGRGTGRGARGTGAGGPRGSRRNGSTAVGRTGSDSTSSTVSRPGSGPLAEGASSTRGSLTREPFVLPRSDKTSDPRAPGSGRGAGRPAPSRRTRPLSVARPIVSGRPSKSIRPAFRWAGSRAAGPAAHRPSGPRRPSCGRRPRAFGSRAGSAGASALPPGRLRRRDRGGGFGRPLGKPCGNQHLTLPHARVGDQADARPVDERVAVGRAKARAPSASSVARAAGGRRGRPGRRGGAGRGTDAGRGSGRPPHPLAPSPARAGAGPGPVGRGSEQPGGLALEEPFEEALDSGKGSHVGGGV